MASAGNLSLRLRQQGGRIVAADVTSARPQAAGLFRGKTPAAVVQLAPMLFSLCGGAQGVAAEAALQAAQGQPQTEQVSTERAARVRRETALEHLWRLMLDWPQLLGLARRETAFAECRRACRQAKSDAGFALALQATMEAELLGQPVADWLDCDAVAWEAWKAHSPAPGAQLLRGLQRANLAALPPTDCLPPMAAAAWAGIGAVGQPGFSALPSLRDKPRETGGLARLAGHARVSPLLTAGRNIEARLVARLVDLANIAGGRTGDPRAWADAAACGDGVGLARVETARGVLIHRAVVTGGVVADYAIVAPTEWNFHPQGAFAREAARLVAEDDAGLQQQARILALSLDPCVAYEVSLEHA
jgi:hypothetical protein